MVRAARSNEVDRKSSDHPFVAQRLGNLEAGLLDRGAVVRAGREAAAEKHLGVESAQVLIVGGQGLDFTEGIDAKLGRGGLLGVALDPGFDDSLCRAQLGEELFGGFAGGDASQVGVQAFGNPAFLRAAGCVAEVQHGVALAGETFIELDHHAPERGLTTLEPRDGLGDVPRVAQSLLAIRYLHAGLAEQPPAAGLRTERHEQRVAGVQRHA